MAAVAAFVEDGLLGLPEGFEVAAAFAALPAAFAAGLSGAFPLCDLPFVFATGGTVT